MDNSTDIVNNRKKQDELLAKIILFLCDWMEDNECNLRSSIVDSINYNIAYVEVFWFEENKNSDLHVRLFKEDKRKVGTYMSFKEAFQTLQSSFDNIIFNQ